MRQLQGVLYVIRGRVGGRRMDELPRRRWSGIYVCEEDTDYLWPGVPGRLCATRRKGRRNCGSTNEKKHAAGLYFYAYFVWCRAAEHIAKEERKEATQGHQTPRRMQRC